MIGDRFMWGKGYATEAIQLTSEYAFNYLKLLKLNAVCYESNVGSILAFLKASYTIEGY